MIRFISGKFTPKMYPFTFITLIALSLFSFAKLDFNSDCLLAHNNIRISERKPTLQINDNLMKWSKKRATEMAAKCTFDHNGNANSGYGENIAADSEQCSETVKQWSDEKQFYDSSNPSYLPETANYTQLVWKDTRYVGCYMANSADDCKYRSITVCNYYKPGNKDGLFGDNV